MMKHPTFYMNIFDNRYFIKKQNLPKRKLQEALPVRDDSISLLGWKWLSHFHFYSTSGLSECPDRTQQSGHRFCRNTHRSHHASDATDQRLYSVHRTDHGSLFRRRRQPDSGSELPWSVPLRRFQDRSLKALSARTSRHTSSKPRSWSASGLPEKLVWEL